MADKPNKADLNIYLVKSEVKTPEDIIKNASELKCIELPINGINPCKLFIKNSFSTPARWARFFTPDVDTNEFGKNLSTGALLYAKVDNAVFMLTFGQGFHLFDSAMIEMNFGLKVSLNLLDTASIRSIDKSSFEQHPKQSREQTGIATELQYFGLNIEQDLLRAITGEPNNKEFGKRISGYGRTKIKRRSRFKGTTQPAKTCF